MNQRRLAEEKEDLERQRKILQKKKHSNSRQTDAGVVSSENVPDENVFVQPRPVMDVSEEEELLRSRLLSLKRDELENQSKLERLPIEREMLLIEGNKSGRNLFVV